MRAADIRRYFQGAALATAVAFAAPTVARAQNPATTPSTPTAVVDDDDLDDVDDDDTDLGWLGLLGLAGLLGLRRRNVVHHTDHTHTDTTRRM